MDRERIGYLLNQYVNPSLVLGNQIGRGGMGQVFDLKGYECEAVLKVVDLAKLMESVMEELGDAAGNAAYEYYYNNFLRKTRLEINYLRELKGCSGITRLIDAYEFDNPEKCFFIIQEKYQELDDFIKTQNITQGLLIQMATDILKMLEILEKKQIIHRDIKPGNLFIKWECGKPKFILGDFGMARNISYGGGKVSICGTPGFLAPELAANGNAVGFNSDIFSLGASLFYILTQGRVPAMFYRENKMPLMEQGSPGLRQIILKAIEQNPTKRYQHPSEMLIDLQRLPDVNNTVTIIYNVDVYLAKKAILEGNLQKAQMLAVRGMLEKGGAKGAKACFRIYMYLQMKMHKDYTKIKSEDIKNLAEIADGGDAVAQYLYGLYLFDTKREYKGIEYMRRSAENGSEIGCYVYGRIFCQGYTRKDICIGVDMDAGIKYLEQAALKGYIPAIRYLKRLKERYADNYFPDDEIRRLLQTEIKNYEEMKHIYIIPFI